MNYANIPCLYTSVSGVLFGGTERIVFELEIVFFKQWCQNVGCITGFHTFLLLEFHISVPGISHETLTFASV